MPGSALLPVIGDAVADLAEAAKFLDVDVDHLAGMLALIANDWGGRFDIPEPPLWWWADTYLSSSSRKDI